MTAIGTDFSVASGVGKITPAPEWPIDSPVILTPEASATISGASLLDSVEAPDIEAPVTITTQGASAIGLPSLLATASNPVIDTPVVASSVDAPSIDTPVAATAESSPSIDTPVAASSVAAPSIDTPTSASSVDAPVIDTPVASTPESNPVIDTPVVISPVSDPAISTPTALTANAADSTAPPFPLNHARILWDNLLFNYLSVVQDSGTNPSYAIAPNTYQRWEFDAGGSVIITLPANVDMDTVCVCAHNLSGSDYTVGIDYDTTDAGTFSSFTTGQAPERDYAMMFHISSTVSVRRLKITCSGTGNGKYIGYISAGVALQMQRPFFGGYTPVNENVQHRYYDAWTESGQLVGRSGRSVMLEGEYSWENIDDSWYREYFEPFKLGGQARPFVAAWNLLEHPTDVEMVMANKIEASAYTGTLDYRSIKISVKGVV